MPHDPTTRSERWSTGLTGRFARLVAEARQSNFARQARDLFATRVALVAVGLGNTILVARTLGPEGRGMYAVATAVSTIGIQVINLGLQASNTYYVARDR